jgi:hypothetical protein
MRSRLSQIMLRFDRIPRMGRRIAFEKNRFARANTPSDARPALLWTKAVKASSPNASMLMKWWAGFPKSVMFERDMQMSAFRASLFSILDL